MIRSFLGSLEKEGVRFLLINGQACVLYGASQFTEDVDLWIRPSAADLRGLLKALARARAVVHKLTPPMTLSRMRRGHGFHFLLPPDVYVDVMGVPPRVGPFRTAWERARRLETDWGRIRVVSPEDLVLLKRTNRPADYEAISNLARLRTQESPEDRAVIRWALQNTFDVDDLIEFARSAAARGWPLPRRAALSSILPFVRAGKRPPAQALRRAARDLAVESADVQDQGRRYWLPRLRELKQLRTAGKLLRPGTPVVDLL